MSPPALQSDNRPNEGSHKTIEVSVLTGRESTIWTKAIVDPAAQISNGYGGCFGFVSEEFLEGCGLKQDMYLFHEEESFVYKRATMEAIGRVSICFGVGRISKNGPSMSLAQFLVCRGMAQEPYDLVIAQNLV